MLIKKKLQEHVDHEFVKLAKKLKQEKVVEKSIEFLKNWTYYYFLNKQIFEKFKHFTNKSFSIRIVGNLFIWTQLYITMQVINVFLQNYF